MPAPVTPSDFQTLIPSPGGNFCEKFVRGFRLPEYVWRLVSWIWNNDGTFTDEFIAEFCAQSCAGGGGVPPGGLLAPQVDASDGQFADRILITWTVVPNAITYDLYRNTVNSSTSANKIAEGLSGASYEDTAVTPNQYYYYWVRARNATQESAFSLSNRGHAGTVSDTLGSVTDLVASQGFNAGSIFLSWTPVVGAEKYDIYRNTSDTFQGAALIAADKVPWNTSVQSGPNVGQAAEFGDNGDHLVFRHTPSAPAVNLVTQYFFWVIPKRSSPPAMGNPSNNGFGAKGWSEGWGDQVLGLTVSVDPSGIAASTPAGRSKAWVALSGAGAGGAGGNISFGGGGGGGGATATGWISVAVGSKFRVINTPNSPTSNAAAGANGQNGSTTALEYSANGLFTDTVVLATCSAATGGQFNAGGGGAGGTGATASNGTLNEFKAYSGMNGRPGNGISGGGSGNRFGDTRLWQAHGNCFGSLCHTGDGGSKGAGSGSKGGSATLATGGKGDLGRARLYFVS